MQHINTVLQWLVTVNNILCITLYCYTYLLAEFAIRPMLLSPSFNFMVRMCMIQFPLYPGDLRRCRQHLDQD